MCVLYDTKDEYDYHYVVKSIEMKIQGHSIPASRLVINYTIEEAPVCYVSSRVDEAMVAELTVHAVSNVIKLSKHYFLANDNIS